MDRKEKLMLFHQLHDESQAENDLKLLVKKNPLHKDLHRFARNPRRYAGDILYVLLDVCSRNEIVDNRKSLETPEEPAEDGSSKALTDTGENKDAVDDSLKNNNENTADGSSNTLTEDDSNLSKEKVPPEPEASEDSKKK